MGGAGLWDPRGTWEAAGRFSQSPSQGHQRAHGSGTHHGPAEALPPLLVELLVPVGVQRCGARCASNPDTQRTRRPVAGDTEVTSASPSVVLSQTPKPQLTQGGPRLRRQSPRAPSLLTVTIRGAGQTRPPGPPSWWASGPPNSGPWPLSLRYRVRTAACQGSGFGVRRGSEHLPFAACQLNGRVSG